MIRLNTEQLIALHTLLSEKPGTDDGIRDTGLLESASESVYLTFGGEELYPTVVEKAARLGFALISNHAFVDGNKRIGVLAMLVLLELNGVKHSLTNDDVTDIGLGVASGNMSYEELVSILNSKII